MKVENDYRFSDVFRGYRKRWVVQNKLRNRLQNLLKIKLTSANAFTQILFMFKQILGSSLNAFVSFFRLGNSKAIHSKKTISWSTWKRGEKTTQKSLRLNIFGIAVPPSHDIYWHWNRTQEFSFTFPKYIKNNRRYSPFQILVDHI